MNKEERKAHYKAYQKAYQKSDKYKACQKAYQKSDKYKAYQKAYMKAHYKTYYQKYVKIPCLNNLKNLNYVYADGEAQEIQKQVPELTQKIMLKLLNENE